MRSSGNKAAESRPASPVSLPEAREDILRRCRSQVSIRAVRASGPGGQNVNKVSTAVQLRFDIRRCTALDQQTRSRLVSIGGTRVTTHDVLVIQSERHRSQLENRRQAIRELSDLLAQALRTPKRRRQTGPTKASQEERLRKKRRRSLLKHERKAGDTV